MTMATERPGREIPKEYREVIDYQISQHGWWYEHPANRQPRVYPADRSKPPIVLASTPSDRRALKNFVAAVRRAGGEWPPGRRA
ncbi:hypothetical protein [Jiangella alkaliphila]|nr:hypothetical protein [Jiangella alkaliphila]